MRLHLVEHEVRAHQPDAAIDVVADATGRDHAPFRRIGRAHAADAEAIAPMDVGHRQAGVLDAGQKGDVRDLLRGLVVLDRLDQRIVGEDQAIDPHPGLVRLRNSPAGVADALERTVIRALNHVSRGIHAALAHVQTSRLSRCNRLAKQFGQLPNLSGDFSILMRQQRLRAVGQRFFGTIVDLDVDAVGPRRDARQRTGRDEIWPAGRMAGIDDNRQVRKCLHS